MKQLRNVLFIILCTNSIYGMGATTKTSNLSKHELETCTIICQRTGTIDDECRTTAVFFEDSKPQAKITYTLQGSKHARPPAHYNGPVQHLNNCFLGRITNLERIDPNALRLGLYVLPAFAIHNLKELHKRQNTDGFIEDKNLYIDALLDSQDPYTGIYKHLFGFEKVDSGNLGDIYLLDPSNQEKFAYKCDNLLLPPSSITIEEKSAQELETSPEPSEEFIALRKTLITQSRDYITMLLHQASEFAKLSGEAETPNPIPAAAAPNTPIDLQELLEEQGKLTRGDRQKKPTPSQLPIPIPTAAAPVHAAFPRLIRRVPQSKIRKPTLPGRKSNKSNKKDLR